jgi:transposase-like protein
MAKIRRNRGEGKLQPQVATVAHEQLIEPINARLEVIRQLIPLGLEALGAMLHEEVERLAGARYEHSQEAQFSRWGTNPGSVILDGQKVPMRIPRVRDTVNRKEVKLPVYEAMKGKDCFDQKAFNLVLKGVSCRDYDETARHVPEAFCISKTSVSEGFKRVSAKKLKDN